MIIRSITLSTGWQTVEDGQKPHVATGTYSVPVQIDPDLPTLGETPHVYGRPIVLREWNEQVLLHEVLHWLLDCLIPYEKGGLSHKVINTVEVGLTTAGYRLQAVERLDLADTIEVWWKHRVGARAIASPREHAEDLARWITDERAIEPNPTGAPA